MLKNHDVHKKIAAAYLKKQSSDLLPKLPLEHTCKSVHRFQWSEKFSDDFKMLENGRKSVFITFLVW